MKKWYFVLASFLLTASVSAAAPVPLRVATSSTYPPYEFRNQKGELDGFDIELMTEISHRMGRTIKWADMGYDMVIPELLSKRTDVICAGMSATPIRAQRVLFSSPYAPTMSAFVIVPGRHVATLGDLRALRGAVPVGTTQDVFLTPLKKQYQFTLRLFPNIEDCVWDLVTGRSDFTLMDVPVAHKMAELPKFKGKIAVGGTIELTGAGKALAVRKGESGLKQQLDTALKAMENDGFLPNLRRKWKLSDH